MRTRSLRTAFNLCHNHLGSSDVWKFRYRCNGRFFTKNLSPFAIYDYLLRSHVHLIWLEYGSYTK